MPVDFVPASPAFQMFLTVQVASFGVSLRWSVLSRVRVISDPAERSPQPRRGIFVGTVSEWFPRGSLMAQLRCYVYMCILAGLAAFRGLRMPVDLCPLHL